MPFNAVRMQKKSLMYGEIENPALLAGLFVDL